MRFPSLLAVFALTFPLSGGAQERLPYPDFLLEDINPASARVGQMVSPRQYGEWVSVYYFGQET